MENANNSGTFEFRELNLHVLNAVCYMHPCSVPSLTLSGMSRSHSASMRSLTRAGKLCSTAMCIAEAFCCGKKMHYLPRVYSLYAAFCLTIYLLRVPAPGLGHKGYESPILKRSFFVAIHAPNGSAATDICMDSSRE